MGRRWHGCFTMFDTGDVISLFLIVAAPRTAPWYDLYEYKR